MNTIFLQASIAGEFSPITRDVTCKKKSICKTDLFHQNKLDQNLFPQIFSHVFEKYHSWVVLGALSEALKVPLLRAMTIQSVF